MKPWDIGEYQPALDSVKQLFKGCVLDIGSGLGNNSIWISSLPDVTYVLGVEISRDSVKETIERLKSSSIPTSNVSIVLSDIHKICKHIRNFDVLLDSAFFHNMSDYTQKKYLEEITPCIKIGGKCVMLVFSDDNPESWYPPHRPRGISPEHAREMWTSAGWSVDFISKNEFYNVSLDWKRAHALLMVATRVQ